MTTNTNNTNNNIDNSDIIRAAEPFSYHDRLPLGGGAYLSTGWDGCHGERINIYRHMPGATSSTAYRGMTIPMWEWVREAIAVWERGGYVGETIHKLVRLHTNFPDRKSGVPVTDDEYEWVTQSEIHQNYANWVADEPNRHHVTDDAIAGRENAWRRMNAAKARIDAKAV